jgi:hypothetical protein
MSNTFTCDQFTEINPILVIENGDYKDTKYETNVNNYNEQYKMYALVGYRENYEKKIINDIFIINNKTKYTIIENNQQTTYNIQDESISATATATTGYVIIEDINVITFKLLGDETNINTCDANYINSYTGNLFLSFYENINFPDPVDINTLKSASIFFRLNKPTNNKITLQVDTATLKNGTENVYISGGNINDENENQNNDDNDNELNNQLIEGGSDKLLNKVYDNNNNLNNKRHSFKRKKITNS